MDGSPASSSFIAGAFSNLNIFLFDTELLISSRRPVIPELSSLWRSFCFIAVQAFSRCKARSVAMDIRAPPHSAANDLSGSAKVSQAQDVPNSAPFNNNARLEQPPPPPSSSSKKQRKRHGGKRRRARRPSFAVSEEVAPDTTPSRISPQIEQIKPTPRPSLLNRRASSCSMESDSLLDHRYVPCLLLMAPKQFEQSPGV